MNSNQDEDALRLQLVEASQLMAQRGLNRGTSGNASVRCGDKMLVTPSGLAADLLSAQSMVLIDAQGDTAPGSFRPSSEWRMHWGILASRNDVSAVVHCHSRHATILACTGRPIPSLHYMVAVSGRADIPLSSYHTFGSTELADAAVATMRGGSACLLANHGQLVASSSLSRAVAIAEEVEELAAIYCGALAIGSLNLLSAAQMDDVLKRFEGYGQERKSS